MRSFRRFATRRPLPSSASRSTSSDSGGRRVPAERGLLVPGARGRIHHPGREQHARQRSAPSQGWAAADLDSRKTGVPLCLGAGSHTVRIARGTPGAWIDRFELRPAPASEPHGANRGADAGRADRLVRAGAGSGALSTAAVRSVAVPRKQKVEWGHEHRPLRPLARQRHVARVF